MSSLNDFAPFRSLRRHEEYFLVGGDLFFLVEQTQFRVHRYFFERESKYFQSKLAHAASPGSSAQGGSEGTAIFLDDVKAENFAKFLWVFYNSKYSLYNANVYDWVAILELAHRWEFPEVKSLAVRELEKQQMPDIERIVVYQKHDIDRKLLIPCYSALCQRESPLSLDEGTRLGMETTLNIVRARELARSTPASDGTRSPIPANIEVQELGGLLRTLFHIVDGEKGVEPTPAPLANSVPPVGNGSAHHHQPQQHHQPQDSISGTSDIFKESELFKNDVVEPKSTDGVDPTAANGDANGANGTPVVDTTPVPETPLAEQQTPQTPSTPAGTARKNKKK